MRKPFMKGWLSKFNFYNFFLVFNFDYRIAMKAGEWENALLKIDYFLSIDPENSRIQEFKLICLKKLGYYYYFNSGLKSKYRNSEKNI